MLALPPSVKDTPRVLVPPSPVGPPKEAVVAAVQAPPLLHHHKAERRLSKRGASKRCLLGDRLLTSASERRGSSRRLGGTPGEDSSSEFHKSTSCTSTHPGHGTGSSSKRKLKEKKQRSSRNLLGQSSQGRSTSSRHLSSSSKRASSSRNLTGMKKSSSSSRNMSGMDASARTAKTVATTGSGKTLNSSTSNNNPPKTRRVPLAKRGKSHSDVSGNSKLKKVHSERNLRAKSDHVPINRSSVHHQQPKKPSKALEKPQEKSTPKRTRPLLIRSNSLDSKLSEISEIREKEQPKDNSLDAKTTHHSISKPQTGMKRSGSAGNKRQHQHREPSGKEPEPQQQQPTPEPTPSKPQPGLRRSGSSGTKRHQPRKKTVKRHKSKSIKDKTSSSNERPTLIRSNSLDSKLSQMEDAEKDKDGKPEVLKAEGQQPKLKPKKQSSKRSSLENKKRSTSLTRSKASQKQQMQREQPTKEEPPKRSNTEELDSNASHERRELIRSNSLDSKLSNMDGGDKDGGDQGHKKVGEKAAKEDKKSKTDRKDDKQPKQPTRTRSGDNKARHSSSSCEITTKDSTSKTPRAQRRGLSKRLSLMDMTRHGSKEEKARPILVRSNSLDSKLSSLAGESNIEIPHDNSSRTEKTTNKQSDKPQAERPSLAQQPKRPSKRTLANCKRTSRRRILTAAEEKQAQGAGPSDDDKQGTTTTSAAPSSLGAKSEHAAARRGRGRRRSLLGDHLATTSSSTDHQKTTTLANDPTAIAANGYFFRRSQSVDSRHVREADALLHNKTKDTTASTDLERERTASRSRSVRRVSMLVNKTADHALKMHMERTVKEEAAVEEAKMIKKEKISSIQKTFQSLAREQSKFADTLLAKMSLLSRVPSVNRDITNEAADGTSTGLPASSSVPSLRRDGSITTTKTKDIRSSSSKPPKTSANHHKGADGRPVGALKRSSSISDMAKRMKDLSANFRTSKRQMEDESETTAAIYDKNNGGDGAARHGPQQQRRSSIDHLTTEIPLLMNVPTIGTSA